MADKQITITLRDSDLWGIECALIHGEMTGYFKENKDWYKYIRDLISKARGNTES